MSDPEQTPQQYASRRYRSPVDPWVRIITAVAVGTSILALLLIGFMPGGYQVVTGFFLAFIGITATSAYSFRPIAYGLGSEGVVIYFRWRRLHIPWRTVRAVRVEPQKKAFRAIRTLGSPGICGWLGRYWSPALGFHTRLVTDRSRVVILFRRVTYCISPDDPDRFAREARQFLKGARDSEPKAEDGGTRRRFSLRLEDDLEP